MFVIKKIILTKINKFTGHMVFNSFTVNTCKPTTGSIYIINKIGNNHTLKILVFILSINRRNIIIITLSKLLKKIKQL